MWRITRLLYGRSWRAVADTPHFDVCVIGGGPAGIAAAMRAVDYNKKVCLIEAKRIGGADLWNGALQSKTMWHFANFLQKTRGVQAERLFGHTLNAYHELDEEAMHHSMELVSTTREHQILRALEATSVRLLFGIATFTSNYEVQVHDRTTKEYRCVSADYFIIATGSSPREHPFVPVDGRLVLTSEHIMNVPLPDSLVIVGAGVIGCEFASIFAALGKTRVSIIDKAPNILPQEDRDVVQLVEQSMERAGITIHHDSFLYDLQPWEVEDEDSNSASSPSVEGGRRCGVQYTVMNHRTKRLTTYNVDRALISIGRSNKNYSGLGIENTSLRTKDGFLIVNAFGQCADVDHIYAVGDAATRMYLVSMGEARAKIAIDHIYSTKKEVPPQLEEAMSSVAFLTTPIASVGLNETQCRQRNIGYIAAKYGYRLVSRAVAAASTDGFVKIIVSNDAERSILGLRAAGLNSSTLVDLGSLAIQNNQTAYDLGERLTAYPAISQAFQECLRAILGRSALKPGAFDCLTLTEWKPNFYERGAAHARQLRMEAERVQENEALAQEHTRECEKSSREELAKLKAKAERLSLEELRRVAAVAMSKHRPTIAGQDGQTLSKPL